MIEERDTGWAFTCPAPCGFDSSGWDTEAHATLRAAQHQREHDTGDLMPDVNKVHTYDAARAEAELSALKEG